MNWQISIPHRHRDEPISVVGELARHLEDPENRRVVRRLALDAAAAGDRTVGDLLDRLQMSGPVERRVLLAEARSGAGLPAIEKVEARREFERVNSQPSHRNQRDERGRRHQACHHPGCTTWHAVRGHPVPTAAKRWFCAVHEHHAEDGDLGPVDTHFQVGASGTMSITTEERN